MVRPTRRTGARRAAAVVVALVALAGAWTFAPPRSGPWGFPGSSGGRAVGPLAPGASVEVAPAYVPTGGVRDLGPVSNQTVLRVAVGLAPADPGGLLAQEVLEYAQGAPQYHHFLSASEVAARFAPSPASYDSAAAVFARDGLSVDRSPDRLLLLVSGSAPAVGAAFHTSFERYEGPSGAFYSHPTPASLPSGWAWTGAVGLGTSEVPRPSAVRLPFDGAARPLAGCATAFGLTPCEVHTAYDENGLLGSGVNGSGVTVGVVDTYDSAEKQPTLASDFATFTSTYGLPSGRLQFLYPVPTSVDLNASKSSGWGVEEGLDVEWARAAAPGDSVDMTLAPDASAGLYASVDWLVAHQRVNVLSLSWGEPDVGIYNPVTMPCSSGCNATSDGSYTLLHPVLQEAALEGISVFSASGDCGAADGTRGVATGFPASDPAVTGVGGTVLSLNASSGWAAETGWSGNATGNSSGGCQNQGGSGGGYSPFPRPWWQRAPGLPATPDVRGVPDVAVLGGTAVSVILGGSSSAVAGTSVSTPVWAGVAAIADQAHGSPLGLLNPSLYAVARGGSYSTAFHDITGGTNGYNAGTGWDPVTGVGTPIVGALVPLLSAGPALSPGVYATVHASPRFGPVGLDVTIRAAASGGSGSYPLYDIDFGDGNATIAAAGVAQHVYPHAGAFTVRATVFDSSGNSSTAPPVAVVVGGGAALNVSLGASTTAPAVGIPVTFTVGVSGGHAPFRYNYSFGDGTYLDNSSAVSAVHTYAVAGGYCAAVEVRDLLAAPDGGASPRVSLRVGGAAAAPCEQPANLSVGISATFPSADVPGDFAFSTPVSGGIGPVTTQLVSDDPYVGACNCGIFRTPGIHPVTVYANDSLVGQAEAQTNVGLFPALSARFAVGAPSGTAPLSETFTASATGGHLADANQTFWSFGDGGSGRGASVAHVYATPGRYVAIGNLSDSGFGNASEAFLIDVLPAGARGPILTANITPAVHTASGAPMTFRATASGGTPAYRYAWTFGDGNSAIGPVWQQTFSPHGCLANGTCPLVVGLSLVDATGAAVNASFTLAPLFASRWSGMTLLPTVPATGGVTPFPFHGSAGVGGIPPTNVSWNFGDGASAWGATVRHTFLDPGNFTVVLRATDRVGDVLTRAYAYPITGTPQTGPTVSGGPNVTQGIVPLEVGFTALGAGGSGPPYTFNWSFGDGSPYANGTGVVHRYNQTGFYNAQVTVADAIGTTGAAGWSIDVYNTTAVTTTAVPSFPTSTSLRLALRIAAACSPESVRGCSNALVRMQLTWSGPGTSSFPGNPDAGIVGFPLSGYANVTLGVPSAGGTYHLAIEAVGPAFTGGVTLVLGIAGTPTTLGGIVLSGPWIVAIGGAFGAALAAGVAVARTRKPPGRRPPPPPSGPPPTP